MVFGEIKKTLPWETIFSFTGRLGSPSIRQDFINTKIIKGTQVLNFLFSKERGQIPVLTLELCVDLKPISLTLGCLDLKG